MNPVRGFTLVEVMLVVAVLGLLAAATLPPVRMFQRTASLQTSAQDVQEMLRLARHRTIASEEESVYGVSFGTGALPHSATLFRGPSFAERVVETDETRTFPGSIEIFDVALSTGGQEVVFERLTGDASASGTISLRLADNPDQRAFVSIAGNGNIYPGLALESPELRFEGGTTDGDLGSFPGNSGWGDIGQTFTTGEESMSVGTVKLFLKRATASPSNVYLEIRSGATTGPVLGASAQTVGSSLPDSLSWVSFSFSPAVALDPRTLYALRLRSDPPSTQAFSGAVGTVHWGYVHAASSPPAYGSGDAWRYIGRNGSESDQGQQLGPSDQYDFSFELSGSAPQPPSNADSRHVNVSYLGRTIDTGSESIELVLSLGGDLVEQSIPISPALVGGQIEWSGSVEVAGKPQELRIHTLFLNDPDEGTVFSIHRDRRVNTSSLSVSLSGDSSGTIISYEEDGTVADGTSIYAQDPEQQ